jgi:hypothetical protein
MSTNRGVIIFFSAYLLAFLLFFVRPVLFNSEMIMKETITVPFQRPIGVDLQQGVSYIKAWQSGEAASRGLGTFYPPLYNIIMLPFTWMPSQTSAFILMTIISFCSYFFISVIFPLLSLKNKSNLPLILAMATIGMISYPFIFEIERGQSNLLATALALVSVYLFHNVGRLKYISYFLLTVAVQIKLYPLIFVFSLIDQNRKWHVNVLRVFGIIFFNVGLIFVLGINEAKNLITSLTTHLDGGAFYREINMSLSCYFKLASPIVEKISPGLASTVPIIQIIALLMLLIGFGFLVLEILKNKMAGDDAGFLLACILLTLLLPGVSHDYKLSYLGGPLIYFILKNEERIKSGLYFVLCFFYFSTLWHFWDHKQGSYFFTVLFKVNTPAIYLTYFVIIFLYVRSRPKSKLN